MFCAWSNTSVQVLLCSQCPIQNNLISVALFLQEFITGFLNAVLLFVSQCSRVHISGNHGSFLRRHWSYFEGTLFTLLLVIKETVSKKEEDFLRNIFNLTAPPCSLSIAFANPEFCWHTVFASFFNLIPTIKKPVIYLLFWVMNSVPVSKN